MAATATAPKNAPKAPASDAPAVQSTKPGEEAAPAAKPPRPERVTYPGLNPGADGKGTVKLDDYPKDHDPKIHKPLTRKDFKNEAPLLERQADTLQKRVDKLRQEAVMCKTMGSSQDRAKAKKLRQVMETMAKLRADLTAQGVDVDALLGATPDKPAA